MMRYDEYCALRQPSFENARYFTADLHGFVDLANKHTYVIASVPECSIKL
jgi:hypothetical protein